MSGHSRPNPASQTEGSAHISNKNKSKEVVQISPVTTEPVEKLSREQLKISRTEIGHVLILGAAGVGKKTMMNAISKAHPPRFRSTKCFDAWPDLFEDVVLVPAISRGFSFERDNYDGTWEAWDVNLCTATNKGTMADYLKAIKYSPEPTGFLIMYSHTDKNSLFEAEKWYKALSEMFPKKDQFDPEWAYLLLGNKVDDETKKACSQYDCKTFANGSISSYDTSAVRGDWVKETGETIVGRMHNVLIPKRPSNVLMKPNTYYD